MTNKNPPVQWDDEDSAFDFEAEEAAQAQQTEFASMLGDMPEDDEVEFLKPGEAIKGTVASVGEMDIMVDLDSQRIGLLPKDDIEGDLPKAGDPIDAFVMQVRGSEVILSKHMKASLKGREGLEHAYQNKIPLKGRVTGKNKGGFEITMGATKAFCPISQIDKRFVEDQSAYMNKEYEFLVEKMSGRDVVVSRTAALKILEEAKREEMLQRYQDDPDTVFSGEVVGLKDFGCFVDLGGIEGMVHISELSLSRVNNVSEVVAVGDQVQVKIKEIKGDRVSLSMKACTQDPWTTVEDDFQIGSSVSGRVVRLIDPGAFVELKPGIDGFVHVSEMSWLKKVRHPKDVLTEGQLVEARILSIDTEARRMSLSLKSLDADPWLEAKSKVNEGSTMYAKVEALKPFGALMELVPGVTGLLPISTIKRAFGEQYRKPLQPGLEIEVKILNRDDAQQKVLLALPNVEEDSDDRSAFDEYLKAKEAEQAKGAELKADSRGSFGDLLAAQLKKN